MGSVDPAVLLPILTSGTTGPSRCRATDADWSRAVELRLGGADGVAPRRTSRSHVALFTSASRLLYGASSRTAASCSASSTRRTSPLTMVKPLLAPVATMVGWCVVLYMATSSSGSCAPGCRCCARRVALGAAVATRALLDLQIDPLATAAGCWVWDSSAAAVRSTACRW